MRECVHAGTTTKSTAIKVSFGNIHTAQFCSPRADLLWLCVSYLLQGFHKILKKHDKLLPHAPCRQFYVAHLHQQPWVQVCVCACACVCARQCKFLVSSCCALISPNYLCVCLFVCRATTRTCSCHYRASTANCEETQLERRTKMQPRCALID